MLRQWRDNKIRCPRPKQGRILGGGAHLPWYYFTPLLKFSAPPPRIIAFPPINACFSEYLKSLDEAERDIGIIQIEAED